MLWKNNSKTNYNIEHLLKQNFQLEREDKTTVRFLLQLRSRINLCYLKYQKLKNDFIKFMKFVIPII